MLYDWLRDIEFAQPFQFILLGLAPILLWVYVNGYHRRQAALTVSTIGTFPTVATWKTALRHIPFAFRILAFILLVVALARPQKRNEEQKVSGEGVDIILTIDVSGSMLAQDFTPNRLEAAKEVAANFVDSRPTDRLGLVIFSGESFTLTPVTTDKSVLKTQIYNIRSGLLEDGTAIGSGLATSVDRLRSSTSKSKIVILLTDGENNGGLIDPNTAKEIAKAVGVRVYTIGVGTEGFAPVPLQSSGGVVIQREKVNIDEKLLKQIADETGGKYFRAKDNETLKNIYGEIDKLEKTRIEMTSTTTYSEKFLPFVIAAAIFLLLETLLRLTVLKKFP
jgi:Ca-activated chloride channel family protein